VLKAAMAGDPWVAALARNLGDIGEDVAQPPALGE